MVSVYLNHQSWYHQEPHASSLCFQNSIILNPLFTPRLRVGWTTRHTRVSTILFFERPFLPILSRDHREEIHKEIANGRTSLRRAKGCVSGNALSQWSGGRAKKVRLYARSRVGRRLAIQSCYPLSARVTKGYNLGQLQPVDICLRCEGMSWSHGQVVRTRFVRLGSNPLSNLSSIAHEFELCLSCLSLLEFVYPYPLRNTSISHDDIHQPPRCRI